MINFLGKFNENLLDDLLLKEFDLLEVIKAKFNMNSAETHSYSCFSQQIKIKPPDVLKSVLQSSSANHFSASQNVFVTSHTVLAPAIPLKARPGFGVSVRESTQDLIMKAKAGLQKGDFIKETQINFQMGELSEK